MNLCKDFLNFINDKLELTNAFKNLNSDVAGTYGELCNIYLSDCINLEQTHLFKITSVVDYLHDELNIGHWSEIPITTRQAFTAASFIKTLIILRLSNDVNDSTLTEALKCIDLGLLLGAPLNDNEELLTKCATLLSQSINKLTPLQIGTSTKRKNIKGADIKGEEVICLKCPSFELFNNSYFIPQIPVKLQDCMTHWPASTKWLNINYLLEVAGNRTVPIEIGSHYVDENWTQKFMSLKEYIQNYYLEKSESVGYLAQHNLFNQIPELKNDICVPDYCALSRDYIEENSSPDINAWFGPEGTVSPLHYDPKDNLLAQVFGTKQIVLFSSNDSDNLYPHDDQLLFNTAQVNPYKPNLEEFPKYCQAKPYICMLEPGEMLYIPLKWWHHVTALDKSFSVSFWWK